MKTKAALDALPLMPRDEAGPVFAEPWQAQVFALVVELNERGEVTWTEWANRLGAELKSAERSGLHLTGEHYYDHWLAALERFAVEKDYTDFESLRAESSEISAADDHRRHDQQRGHHH